MGRRRHRAAGAAEASPCAARALPAAVLTALRGWRRPALRARRSCARLSDARCGALTKSARFVVVVVAVVVVVVIVYCCSGVALVLYRNDVALAGPCVECMGLGYSQNSALN